MIYSGLTLKSSVLAVAPMFTSLRRFHQLAV